MLIYLIINLFICAENQNTLLECRNKYCQDIDQIFKSLNINLNSLTNSALKKISFTEHKIDSNFFKINPKDQSSYAKKLRTIESKFRVALSDTKYKNIPIYCTNSDLINAQVSCKIDFLGNSILNVFFSVIFSSRLVEASNEIIDDIIEHEITHLKFSDPLVLVILQQMRVSKNIINQIKKMQEIRAYAYQFTRSYNSLKRNFKNYYYTCNCGCKIEDYPDYPSAKELLFVLTEIAKKVKLKL